MSDVTAHADMSIKLGMSGCYVTKVECQKINRKDKAVTFGLLVHWSDGKQETISRQYSEVFDFVQALRQRAYEGSTTIPEMKAAKWFDSFWKLKKEQKKVVEDFFQKILNLPESIARGKEVCEFFSWCAESESESQVHAVLSSCPSEGAYETVDLESNGYNTLSIKPKNISVVDRDHLDDSTGTYWAVVEYSKRKSGEVDLKEGAAVSVLQRELSGWWFVHVEDTAEQGWAPASCLLPVDRNNLNYGKITGPFGEFKALKDYEALEPDEISCRMGERVEVIEATLDGWWEVRCKDKVGRIPATNLEPVRNERKLRNSLYHQAGIYKKYSPPPRRNSKVSVEELYGKVDKFRKLPPALTTAKSKNYDEDPEYAEVEFDRKIPKSNYNPPVVDEKNPIFDSNPEDHEEEDSTLYMNTVEMSPRAYVNVEIKPIPKPQKHEIRYYRTRKNHTPVVKHHGRPILLSEIGDILESHKEETDEIFAKILRLASGACPDPTEGWIPKSHLESYELKPGDTTVAKPKTTCNVKNQAPDSSTKSPQPRKPQATKPKPVVDAKCKPTPLRPAREPAPNNHPTTTSNRSQLSCALPERTAAVKAPAEVAEHSKRGVSVGSGFQPEARAAPNQNSPSSQDASSAVEKFTIRKLSRTECENVLLKSATQRQFIIRESTKVGHFALSVRSADRIHHFPIELTPDKKYFIGKYNFDSLEDVIRYYKRNPVFELDDGTGITLESSLET